METILEMRGITKAFPGVKALDDVNLTVRRGEIHALVGENGAGKSTLMKVLSGVYPHGQYDGDIVFDGAVKGFSGIADSERDGIIIIHQELALVRCCRSRRTCFSATSGPQRGDRLGRDASADGRASRPRRAEGTARDEGRASGHRQAAARRNRQGALEGGAPPHSRRADVIPQRERQRCAARTPQGFPRGRHFLDPDLAQAERGLEGGRRITVLRDGTAVATMDCEDGVDEEEIIRHMVGRSLPTVILPAIRNSAGPSSRFGTGRCAIRSTRIARSWTASASSCARAKCWHRGADGCRPHGTGDEPFRPVLRDGHRGRGHDPRPEG